MERLGGKLNWEVKGKLVELWKVEAGMDSLLEELR